MDIKYHAALQLQRVWKRKDVLTDMCKQYYNSRKEQKKAIVMEEFNAKVDNSSRNEIVDYQD